MQKRSAPKISKFGSEITTSDSGISNDVKISNFDFEMNKLLFLSNLISRPKNLNSAPSIWSESIFFNFSSHQNLDFVLGSQGYGLVHC